MASGNEQLKLQAALEITKIVGLNKVQDKFIDSFKARETSTGLSQIINAANKLADTMDRARKNTNAYKQALQTLNTLKVGTIFGTDNATNVNVGQAVQFERSFRGVITRLVAVARKGSVDIGMAIDKIVDGFNVQTGAGQSFLRGLALDQVKKELEKSAKELDRFETNRAQRVKQNRAKKEAELKESQEALSRRLRLEAQNSKMERMQQEVNERNRSKEILDNQRLAYKKAQLEEAERRRNRKSGLDSAVSSGSLTSAQAQRIERKRQEREDRNEIKAINDKVKANYAQAAAQEEVRKFSRESESRTRALGRNNEKERIKDLRDMNRQAESLAKSFDTSHNSVKRFGEQIGLATKRFGAFVIGAAPIYFLLNSIRTAIQDFREFEKVLTRIEQAAGLTSSTAKELAFNLIALGPKTGSSTVEIAQGAEIFAQAGFQDPKQLLEISKQLSKVPLAATFGTIKETAEGLLAVFGQFNKTTSDTAYILDLVNKYAADFAVESKDIFEGIERGGAAFSAAGGSLEEFVQLFSILRETTRESASSLGVFFKTGAARLLSGRSQNLLQSLGVGKGNLREQLQGLSDVFASGKFSDIERIQLSEQLVGKQQFNRLLSLTKALQDPRIQGKVAGASSGFLGSLDEAAKKRIDDIGLSINRLKESLGAFFNGLTQQESLKQFFKILADGAELISKAAPTIMGILPILAALGGVLVGQKFIGPALGGFRKVAFSSTQTRRLDVRMAAREKFSTAGYAPGSQEYSDIIDQRKRFVEESERRLRRRGLLPDRATARRRMIRNVGFGVGAAGAAALPLVDFGNENVNTVASGLGTGAAIGSLAGPWGAAAGGAIGAMLALKTAIEANTKAQQRESIIKDPTRSGRLSKAFIQGFSENNFDIIRDDLLKESQREIDRQSKISAGITGDALDVNKKGRIKAAIGRVLTNNSQTQKDRDLYNQITEFSKNFSDSFKTTAFAQSLIKEKFGEKGSALYGQTIKRGKTLEDLLSENIEFASEALQGAFNFQFDKTAFQQQVNNLNKEVTSYFARLNQYFFVASQALEGTKFDLNTSVGTSLRSSRDRTDFQGIQGFSRIDSSTLAKFGLSDKLRNNLIDKLNTTFAASNDIIKIQQNPNIISDVLETFGPRGASEPREGVDVERQSTLTEELTRLRNIGTTTGNKNILAVQDLENIVGPQRLTELFKEIDQEAISTGQRSEELLENYLKSSDVLGDALKTRERELAAIEQINKMTNEYNGLLNQQRDISLEIIDNYYKYVNLVDNAGTKIKDLRNNTDDLITNVYNNIDINRVRNSPELALQYEQEANRINSSRLSSRMDLRNSTISFIQRKTLNSDISPILNLRNRASSANTSQTKTELNAQADLKEKLFTQEAERALSDLTRQYEIINQSIDSYRERLNLATKALDQFNDKLGQVGDFALGLESGDFEQKIRDLAGFQQNVAIKGVGGALSGLSRQQINSLRGTAGVFDPNLASQITQEFGFLGQGRFNAFKKVNNTANNVGNIQQELDNVRREINSGQLSRVGREIAETRRKELESTLQSSPESLAALDIRKRIDDELGRTTSPDQRNELLRQKGLSDIDLITEDEIRKLREKQDTLNTAQQDAIDLYKEAAHQLWLNSIRQSSILTDLARLNQENADFFKKEISRFATESTLIIQQYLKEIQNAATQILKSGTTSIVQNTIDINPIQVNVALTAPDIINTFGPAIGEQVIAAVIPKIAEAFDRSGNADAASYMRGQGARAA